MVKVTKNQRFLRTVRRMQSPYTTSIPVKTEFGTTVIQLVGVYFSEQLAWVDEETDPVVEIIEERLDLGTHSNLALASKEAAAFREGPEDYYAAHLRVQREQEELAKAASDEVAA